MRAACTYILPGTAKFQGENSKIFYANSQDFLVTSDSQRLLRGPQVVRVISRSGPQIPIQINNLCSEDHQIILSGPCIRKVGEPLIYTVVDITF